VLLDVHADACVEVGSEDGAQPRLSVNAFHVAAERYLESVAFAQRELTARFWTGVVTAVFELLQRSINLRRRNDVQPHVTRVELSTRSTAYDSALHSYLLQSETRNDLLLLYTLYMFDGNFTEGFNEIYRGNFTDFCTLARVFRQT